MGGDPQGGGLSTAGPLELPGDASPDNIGEIGRLLESGERSAGPLGPPRSWPRSLQATVRLCLASPEPRLLWWGPQHIAFYNDGARALLGGRHPCALGQPARDGAPALWNVLGRFVQHVAATGAPVRVDDQLLMAERGGRAEERYVSFTYAPIFEDGRVAGVFCAAEDTTAGVVAARRERCLGSLGDVAGTATGEEDAWRRTLQCCERNPADLAFALLYRLEDDGAAARLVAAAGLVAGTVLAPQHVPLKAMDDAVWPLARALRANGPVLAPGALVLPIAMGGGIVRALLVAGLNPRQPFDPAYREFLETFAGRAGAAVAAADAREAVERRAADLERAQTALARRCAELTRVIEQAPVPIVVTRGPSFVVTIANAAARRSSDGRDLHDRPLFEALPELGGQGFDVMLREVLTTGESRTGKEVHVQLERSGQTRDTYFTFVAAPLRSVSGAVGGVIVIANEVTEQVVARAALVASEARYRGIFDSVDVSIWEEDYSGVKALLAGLEASGVDDMRTYLVEHPAVLRHALGLVRVVDVNAATLKMLGARDKNELLRSLPAIAPPETLPVLVEKLLAIAERRPLLRLDSAACTLDGERRDVMLTMALAPSDTRLERVLTTFADITERKRIEETLRESDRRKDEFLATLAHELRNPLAPLRNCIELLRAAGPKPSPPAVLDIVARQIEHLVRLVDDLLETSRISRGALELRRERVRVSSVVRNAVEASEQLIREAGHALDVRLPDEPLWIDGDPVRVAQILANLLNNAAKYTPAGGHVAVDAKREGESVAITVVDTGIGIAPETLPRLFTLFDRLSERPGGPAGLGIGLALARRLAEMHGGTLDGQSDGLGRGSRFTLRLPLSRGAQHGERASLAQASAALDGRRVLIVDDNRDAADTLSMLLDAAGADVRVAYGGVQALEAFAVHDPDIAIVDIGMPGMDGYELARRLRAEFAERQTVLVALTGWGQEHDRQRAREAGFDHHLVKPAELAALQRLIETIAARRSQRTP